MCLLFRSEVGLCDSLCRHQKPFWLLNSSPGRKATDTRKHKPWQKRWVYAPSLTYTLSRVHTTKEWTVSLSWFLTPVQVHGGVLNVSSSRPQRGDDDDDGDQALPGVPEYSAVRATAGLEDQKGFSKCVNANSHTHTFNLVSFHDLAAYGPQRYRTPPL